MFRPGGRAQLHVVSANWALYIDNYLEACPIRRPRRMIDYGAYAVELQRYGVLQVAIAKAGETAFRRTARVTPGCRQGRRCVLLLAVPGDDVQRVFRGHLRECRRAARRRSHAGVLYPVRLGPEQTRAGRGWRLGPRRERTRRSSRPCDAASEFVVSTVAATRPTREGGVHRLLAEFMHRDARRVVNPRGARRTSSRRSTSSSEHSATCSRGTASTSPMTRDEWRYHYSHVFRTGVLPRRRG